jgi:hypothetical protein
MRLRSEASDEDEQQTARQLIAGKAMIGNIKGFKQFFHKGIQSKKSMTSLKKLDTMVVQKDKTIKYASRRFNSEDGNEFENQETDHMHDSDIKWRDSKGKERHLCSNP